MSNNNIKGQVLCRKCNLQVDAPSVGCDFCDGWYHPACAKVSKTLLAELTKATRDGTLNWKCPRCALSSQQSSQNTQALHTVTTPALHTVTDELSQFKKEIKELILAMDNKLSSQIESLRCDINENIQRLAAETDQKLNTIRNKVEVHDKSIIEVNNELSVVKRQLLDMQRINNLCCIKIIGVPVSANRGLDIQVVKKIAKHYNVMIEPKDIEFCHRLKGKSQTPPIMVRFSSKNIAENIIAKYFRSNGETPLKLSNISEENIDSRVYINEHLTQHNMTLLYECARIKRLKLISKVMTRRGNVFISQSSNKESDLIKVESIACLQDMFPTAFAAKEPSHESAVIINTGRNLSAGTPAATGNTASSSTTWN